jgi:hypothetical protein
MLERTADRVASVIVCPRTPTQKAPAWSMSLSRRSRMLLDIAYAISVQGTSHPQGPLTEPTSSVKHHATGGHTRTQAMASTAVYASLTPFGISQTTPYAF